MKKKLVSLVLASCMVLSLAACGNTTPAETPADTTADTQAEAPADTAADTQAEAPAAEPKAEE